MGPPILAHFGHWYISLPTFMGPMLVLVGWLSVNAWRDRHAPDAAEHDPEADL